MYTLGHERGTAALPRQVKLRTWLDRLVRTAADRDLDGAPLLDDPHAQVALAQALIGIEVLRHHAYRTVGEFLSGGAVGPESSSVKLLMAEAEQRLAATAIELLGPSLLQADPARADEDRFWQETYLYSRAASVYGGTRPDPAQHHRRPRARASPGVVVDLELTDEQKWLERVGRHAARARVAGGRSRASSAGAGSGSSSSSSARCRSAARTGSARSRPA